MTIPLWREAALIAAVLGAAACQTASPELQQDGRHRVETVQLSAELESLGGIGGVSVDSEGHIILANFNKYVWRISPEGDVQVLADLAAGTGTRGFDDSADGIATVSYPNGIAADPGGRFLYFNNHRGIMKSGERGNILLRRLHVDR